MSKNKVLFNFYKTVGVLTLSLEREKLCAVFYKKQDYEPFSVPMGFPVLEDINWKAEMKKNGYGCY